MARGADLICCSASLLRIRFYPHSHLHVAYDYVHNTTAKLSNLVTRPKVFTIIPFTKRPLMYINATFPVK